MDQDADTQHSVSNDHDLSFCFLHHVLLQEKSFFRVKGKVQLGTYRLRSRGLEVSQTFLDDVDSLPTEYEKGQYFGFLEDYGTHYTKNGRAGGEYELVYVLNSKVITDKSKYKSLRMLDVQNPRIYCSALQMNRLIPCLFYILPKIHLASKYENSKLSFNLSTMFLWNNIDTKVSYHREVNFDVHF